MFLNKMRIALIKWLARGAAVRMEITIERSFQTGITKITERLECNIPSVTQEDAEELWNKSI